MVYPVSIYTVRNPVSGNWFIPFLIVYPVRNQKCIYIKTHFWLRNLNVFSYTDQNLSVSFFDFIIWYWLCSFWIALLGNCWIKPLWAEWAINEITLKKSKRFHAKCRKRQNVKRNKFLFDEDEVKNIAGRLRNPLQADINWRPSHPLTKWNDLIK